MVPLLSLKSLTLEFPEQGFSSACVPFMVHVTTRWMTDKQASKLFNTLTVCVTMIE